MPLTGLRVLDFSDHAGALCSRLLADLGADVVRVEPPDGAAVRRADPQRDGASLADLYANANKRRLVLDFTTPAGRADGCALVRQADVVFDARPPVEWEEFPLPAGPRTIVIRITPFGMTGPRAPWRGSDLVCAARAGMVFVNGPSDREPLAPFGLAAYAATGLVGATAALLALAVRDRAGEVGAVDLAVTEAAAAAVEHVTGLYRQTGEVQRRQGTLHWSRTFRVGEARDGLVLMTHLGDWTTLSQWVASECPEARILTDPAWESVDYRKKHAEAVFSVLETWLRTRSVDEVCTGASLRRLPFAPVVRPESIADAPQLVARGFVRRFSDGDAGIAFPAPPWRFSACPAPPRRLPPAHSEEVAAVLRDWTPDADGLRSVHRPAPQAVAAPPGRRAAVVGRAASAGRVTGGERPLDGVVVLDFTWVVAGPVATRILADHGAHVVKVEHRHAPDFGSRRGGLTGNLNRGKHSVVLDMECEAGRALAQRLAARADVVIDNFSARVMDAWGLDHASLCTRRPDAIAVRLTGFGLDGPARECVSYGPTLQALVGYPHLMRGEDDAPAGWGYSWSDMAAGWAGALATLAALRHRERTGVGQLVDVSQFENLVALLGPQVLDLLAGRAVSPPGNASQEGPRVPQGVFRCAAQGGDDDRWLAMSVEEDAWPSLVTLLVGDGEVWADDPALARVEGRVAQWTKMAPRLSAWTRRHRAEDLERRLQACGVAAALVANGADLDRDEQLAARGYFESAAAAGERPEIFDGIPFRTALCPGRVGAPGPLCGEHTDSVLSGMLGLGVAEIEELRAQEVIG